MTHPDPTHDTSKPRFFRRSPALWSGMALVVGAAPWVALLIMMFGD